MKKTKGFFSEFKEFITKGNVIDLAVGVIIGAAFKAIVDSLVNDIIMPVISIITGGMDFTQKWFVQLGGDVKFETVDAAQEAGVSVLNYGAFISAIINFLILAFVIFLFVKGINSVRAKLEKKPEEEEAPTTKICPFCCSEIAIDAVKCPHCTSDIPAEEAEEAE